MNAKTLFATPSRARGYTAADMATASADGWRAGQAADNELLTQCRKLLEALEPLTTTKSACIDKDYGFMTEQSLFGVIAPGVVAGPLAFEVRATLEALDERLA